MNERTGQVMGLERFFARGGLSHRFGRARRGRVPGLVLILILAAAGGILATGCGGHPESGPASAGQPVPSAPSMPTEPPPLRLMGVYPLEGSPWNGQELVFYFDRDIMAAPGATGQPRPLRLEPEELNGALDWQVEGNILRARFSDADLPRIFTRLDVYFEQDLQAGDGGALSEEDRRKPIFIHAPLPPCIAGKQECSNGTYSVEIWAPMASGSWEDQYDLSVSDSAGVVMECAPKTERGRGKLTLNIPTDKPAWPVMVAFAPRETADERVKALGTRGLALEKPSENAGPSSGPDASQASSDLSRQEPSAEQNTDSQKPEVSAFTLGGGDSWRFDDVEGASLYFFAGRPVDRKDLEKRLVITPAVDNLRVEHDEGGFYLRGDWVTGMRYRIQVSPGLKSADGKRTMIGRFEVTTEEAPRVRGITVLNTEKSYLPAHALRPIRLAARNVEKAEIVLWRVFPSTLTMFAGALQGEEQGKWEVERFAEELVRHEVVFPPIPDRKVEVELDPGSILPQDKRGVFMLTIEDPPDVFTWNAYPFVWTDIGMLAHNAGKDVVITAHRLDTLEPVAGATVTLLSSKLQELGSTQTDAEGNARFTLADFRRGKPTLAWIATDTDAAFLALRQSPSEETARGIRQEALDLDPFDAEGYDGYVYSDRNLYRPGETARVRFLVRQGYTRPAAGVVLQARLRNPLNNMLRTWPVTLSEWGTGSLDLETGATWRTGRYVLELVAPGASKTVGSTMFNVESFVPNRIRVAVETDRAFAGPGESVTITGHAEHMYGGPAIGYSGEGRVILTPGKWTPEQWPGFRFSNDSRVAPEVENLGRAMTGPDGSARFTFSVDKASEARAPLEAVARIAVSEPGGRDVVARKVFTVLPAEPALGVLLDPMKDRPATRVRVVAVNRDGAPADLSSVSVALETERWNYNVRWMTSGYTIEADPYYETVEIRDVPLRQGEGETEFSLAELWGRMRVRVFSPATPLYATATLFAGWDRVTLAEDNRPSLVNVTVDKDRYEPGDTCVMTIRSPFDGMAFVALEQDRVLETWRCPVQQGEARLAIPVREDYFPNAWALVTVVRSTTTSPAAGVPLAVFGTANIRVTRPDRNLVVTLPDVPAETRPEQDLNLVVETRTAAGEPVPAEITVAAVDQGIHDILGYDDPDPFNWFERPRKCAFGRSEFYDRIAVDAWTTEAVGGDALERRLGGVPAIGENWIKPVALWSGALRTGTDGRAVVTFHVPDYVGRLHVVAVATTGDQSGEAAADVFVRKPYLLRLTVPRFTRVGDSFEAVARLVNTTQAPCEVTLSWTASGGLKGEGTVTAAPAAGAESIERARFETVSREPGKIRWTAEFRDSTGGTTETVSEETTLTVGPSGLWRTDVALRELKPGEQAVLDAQGFEETDDFSLSVVASASPLLPIMDRLMSLVEYPYGCTEQSVSRAFPLLILAEQLRDFPTGTELDAPWTENRAREAIADVSRRIVGAMLPSGGVAVWPGSIVENSLCTVYAAHFLSLALENGLTTLDEDSWKAMRGRLWSIARGEDLNEALGAELFLRAYAAYVLSLQPEPGVLDLAWQLERAPLPESARMLLTAMVARLTADPGRAEAYRKAAAPLRIDEADDGGALMSPRRECALALLAGCAIPLPGEELDGLAVAARRALTTADRLTTQDAAFLCAALGAYHKARGISVGQATGTIVGPDGEKAIEASRAASASARGKGARITVTNVGSVSLWIRVAREGMTAGGVQDGYSEGDLDISVDWARAGRQPVQLSEGLVQGESYVGILTLSSKHPRRNVAVSIPLPAGLEAVNPRLDGSALAAMGFGQPAGDLENGAEDSVQIQNDVLVPNHTEIRDDRLILVFNQIPDGKRSCFYLVRAVTSGTFTLPGIVAEAMYAPDARAGLPGCTVTVQTP